MRRNSVLDGLRCNLLEFIQESMSEKVLESISSEEVEFEGVKEMYSWCVISIEVVFDRVLRDDRTKRSCIKSEKKWAKNGTLRYTTRKI